MERTKSFSCNVLFLILHFECWPGHEVVCVGTAVFDLVLPFPGDRCRPSSCRGLYHVCLWRLVGQQREQKAVRVCGVKASSSLLFCPHYAPLSLCASLPQGNGWRRRSRSGAVRRHPGLILCPRACLNRARKKSQEWWRLERPIWRVSRASRTLLTATWLLWTIAEGNMRASNSEVAPKPRGSFPFLGTEQWVASHIQAAASLMTQGVPGTLRTSLYSSWVGPSIYQLSKVDEGMCWEQLGLHSGVRQLEMGRHMYVHIYKLFMS